MHLTVVERSRSQNEKKVNSPYILHSMALLFLQFAQKLQLKLLQLYQIE